MKLKLARAVILFGWSLKLKNSFAREASRILISKRRTITDCLQQHLIKSLENVNTFFSKIS